jgi:hypothetical protein
VAEGAEPSVELSRLISLETTSRRNIKGRGGDNLAASRHCQQVQWPRDDKVSPCM